MTLRRILVPVDFSRASLQGLEYAVRLAATARAALTILYVAEPLYYAGDVGLLLEEYRRYGREELARLAHRLAKRGVRCRTLLQTGTPYRVIAAQAKRGDADLIVMSTHGRTGLTRVVMGSVAEKVVRTAPCPVITVPPRR